MRHKYTCVSLRVGTQCTPPVVEEGQCGLRDGRARFAHACEAGTTVILEDCESILIIENVVESALTKNLLPVRGDDASGHSRGKRYAEPRPSRKKEQCGLSPSSSLLRHLRCRKGAAAKAQALTAVARGRSNFLQFALRPICRESR